MKKVLSTILLLALVFLLAYPVLVYADGQGNMDGGGSGMGQGTAQNFWSPGNDGVRITVVHAETGEAAAPSEDFSNKTFSKPIIHFEKRSKLDYRAGAALTPATGSYPYHIPAAIIPYIMTSNTHPANIQAIRQYFCSEFAVRMVSDATGIEYDTLISGDYKLVVEPICYFTYQGNFYAMTATEAALYNQLTGGALVSRLPNVIQRNLPLAIFLETADLGFPAWTGPRNERIPDEQIIAALGIGIVSYKDLPAPEIEAPTRIYTRSGDKGRIIETLHCDNPDCGTQWLRQLIHFAGKKAMDIKDLSKATLAKFLECGWLNSFQDIYHLDLHKEEIIRLEGFGEKSYDNLWAAIEASRHTTFERYLVAMDIPLVGRTASRCLGRKFHGSLDDFEQAVAGTYDFTQLEDIGTTINNNIHAWFSDAENLELWKELQKEMTFENRTEEMTMTEQNKQNPFAGTTIVATGKLMNFTRDGIQMKIMSLGAKAGSAVSKNTDYLICGEKAGSKLAKAQALGVRILSEQEFLSMIGEAS